MLRALVRVGRPGAHFPDAGRLLAHLSFLGPAGSRGVQAALELDPANGLPTLRQLLAVHADREIAASYVREHVSRRGAKLDYYRALLEAEVLPASSVSVRLRRRERGRSHLEVVHDRLDAASGLLLRYTFRLSQRGARHVATEEGGEARPTRRFLALMERHSGADAELALLLVSELGGVSVEEVVRGQLGPLHFAGIEAPPLLAPVIEKTLGAFVLHLAVERAGREVAEDRCRDPFTRLYRESLSEASRAAVETRRAELGYRVSKERRLICTPSAETPLRAALAAAGLALVVRSC